MFLFFCFEDDGDLLANDERSCCFKNDRGELLDKRDVFLFMEEHGGNLLSNGLFSSFHLAGPLPLFFGYFSLKQSWHRL